MPALTQGLRSGSPCCVCVLLSLPVVELRRPVGEPAQRPDTEPVAEEVRSRQAQVGRPWVAVPEPAVAALRRQRPGAVEQVPAAVEEPVRGRLARAQVAPAPLAPKLGQARLVPAAEPALVRLVGRLDSLQPAAAAPSLPAAERPELHQDQEVLPLRLAVAAEARRAAVVALAAAAAVLAVAAKPAVAGFARSALR